MKDFEKIGKAMPYRESDAEVDAILGRVAANALAASGTKRGRGVISRYIGYAASAAAVAVLAVTMGLHFFGQSSTSVYDMVLNSDSMAEVLSEMDADAVNEEAYYTVNLLPEYYVYAQNE